MSITSHAASDPVAAAAPRSRSRWVSITSVMLVVAGVMVLISPVLFAPVTSDSKYHYVLSHLNLNGNLLNLPAWVVHDMGWRLEQGRITPVGVFAQHLQYFLGFSVAQSLGIELYVVEAATRALLIVAGMAAFAWLARELFGRTGYARVVTIVFAGLYATGANAAVTHRSGWTTFVVLCLGSVAIVLASAATVLFVTRRWPHLRRPARWAWVTGLFLIGVAIVLYYEMTVVAFIFTVIILGLRWWFARRAGRPPVPLAPVAALTAGGVVALAVTRAIIRMYSCQGPGCYAGFQQRLDLQWPVDALRGVVGSVPVASGTATAATHGLGALDMTGASLVVFTVIGAATLALAGMIARRSAGTAAADAGASALLAEGVATLVIAAAVTLVATALVMSMSVQAQDEILTGFSSTYRSTPLLWALICVLVAPAVARLLLRPRAAVGAIVVLAVWGALIGGLAVPANSKAARADRARTIGIQENVLKVVVLGPKVYDVTARCAQAPPLKAHYPLAFDRRSRESPAVAFAYLWGEPLCPTGQQPHKYVP